MEKGNKIGFIGNGLSTINTNNDKKVLSDKFLELIKENDLDTINKNFTKEEIEEQVRLLQQEQLKEIESKMIGSGEYLKDSYYEITKLEREVESFKYSHLSSRERKANIVDIRREPKINRNSKCKCGSGKKYKKCCINSLPKEDKEL